MSWRELGKGSVPGGLPLQFAAWLVAFAWVTHAHALAARSVIPMASTLALPSDVIGYAMPAMDGQECPVCFRAPVLASPLLTLNNFDHEETQKLLFASSGAPGKLGLAHIDQINDGPNLTMQIRYCRWNN